MYENEYPEKKVIYSKELKESNSIIGTMSFTPIFDTTDHLHFVCKKCKEIANVTEIYRFDKDIPTIFFKLYCPKCRLSGQRKIYPELKEPRFYLFPTQTELLKE